MTLSAVSLPLKIATPQTAQHVICSKEQKDAKCVTQISWPILPILAQLLLLDALQQMRMSALLPNVLLTHG